MTETLEEHDRHCGCNEGYNKENPIYYKENPIYFCLECNKYLGFRGFCSEKCHNQYYDVLAEMAKDYEEQVERLKNNLRAEFRKELAKDNNIYCEKHKEVHKKYPKDKTCYSKRFDL